MVLGVFGLVGGGAAVAVERVGDPPHRTAQLAGVGDPGVVDELMFDAAHHLGPLGRVAVGDHLHMRTGDLAGRERGRDLRQLVDLASHVDRPLRVPGVIRHFHRSGTPRSGTRRPASHPTGRSRRSLAQPQELDPIRQPAHPLDIERRLLRRDLVDRLLQLRQRIEHTPIIRNG